MLNENREAINYWIAKKELAKTETEYIQAVNNLLEARKERQELLKELF